MTIKIQIDKACIHAEGQVCRKADSQVGRQAGRGGQQRILQQYNINILARQCGQAYKQNRQTSRQRDRQTDSQPRKAAYVRVHSRATCYSHGLMTIFTLA